MLMLAVLCALVTVILAVVAYITRTVKPKRVKLTAGVWKLVNLSFEAEAGDEPKELPPGVSHGDFTENPGMRAAPCTESRDDPGAARTRSD